MKLLDFRGAPNPRRVAVAHIRFEPTERGSLAGHHCNL